jgi:hypothetical protein
MEVGAAGRLPAIRLRHHVLRERAEAFLEELVSEANAIGLSLMFSLRHDFPSEWHRFVVANASAPEPAVPFSATVRRDHFPYFTQGRDVTVEAIQIVAIQGDALGKATLKGAEFGNFASQLKDSGEAIFAPALTGPVGDVLVPDAAVFILIKYSLA